MSSNLQVRAALIASVLLGAISVHAEIQLGEPHYFGTATRGGIPKRSWNLRAVATSWGYFAAWEEDEGLRAARISRDGALLDDPPLTFGPNTWSTAAPIFDGTDVVLSYRAGRRDFGGPQRVELVRVTAAGEIIPLQTLPQAPAEIFWTGTSYILLLGRCTPGEVMQLDRDGSLLRSVAAPIPISTTYCPSHALPPPRVIYRDGGGVFRLFHQTGTAETGYDSYTFALTDANGDATGDGRLEPLDAALPRERFHGAGVMDGGLYLVAESAVHFTDFTGRPVRAPIRLDARQLHAVNDGDRLLVAGVASFTQVVTWRISRDGTVTPLWPSPPDGRSKSLVSVFPFQSGAMVFFLEQLSDGEIPAMWRVRNQRFGNLVQPTIPLVRGIPHHHELTVVPLGSGMLALWQQQSPSYEIRAVMLDSSARETGPSALVLNGLRLRAASNGRAALVAVDVWQGMALIRFGADGRPLDQKPLFVPSLWARDVTWDGSAFLLQLSTHVWRIDESGTPLTAEPVKLPFQGWVLMSAHGPILLHNRRRIPSQSATEALYALPLTDELKPRGEPRLVSIFPTFEIATAVSLGDHDLVIFRHLGRLLATRIGAAGAPLDGDVPQFLAELEGNHKVGHVRGRILLATESIVMDAGRLGSPVTRYEPAFVGGVGAIVAGPGGRIWLFYTKIEQDPRWSNIRPVARELFLD